jgi:spectinomycin phosphotransferase
MLENPGLSEEQILTCLREEYGLHVEQISFLPLGADPSTSVYRVAARAGMNYFLKLRKGDFNEATIAVPNFLSAAGIRQVIPSLTTRTGQLWANLDPFKAVLYPFVEGRAGLEGMMSREQWFEFGTALKRFHTCAIPAKITGNIPKDNFSPRWRARVKNSLERIEQETFHEPVAMELADFLRSKKDETLAIVKRAEQLAQRLQEGLPEFILCHSDLHGWNLLIDQQETLYLVDWDTLIFAPKERDLMFIGGGHGISGYPPEAEETMFYEGYGQTKLNPIAMAYYRYERTIVDIADDCDLILFADTGAEARKEAFEDLQNKFLPNSTIEMAYRADKILKDR